MLAQDLARNLLPSLMPRLIGGLKTPVTANLTMHFATFQEGKNTAQLVDFNESNQVSDLFPLSGTVISANQSFATNMPIYTLNAINGHPALACTFSNATHMFLSAQPVNGTTARTMFAVARTDAPGASLNGLISLTDISAGGTGTKFLFSDAIGVSYLNTTYIADSGSSMVDPTNASIATMTLAANSNSNDTILHKNGIQIFDTSPDADLAVDTNTAGTPGLFSSSQLSQFLNGVVGELLVYDRLLPNSERNAVIRYLSIKWGIVLP